MVLEHFVLQRNDWVPNNPVLPILLYRAALSAGDADAVAFAFEKSVAASGWPAQWRDGIYDFHHYHSTAHEVLGCVSGSALVMLGGPGGRNVPMEAGDAVVLPAGTGHCCINHSSDFLVVGAYPTGQEWDMCKSAPTAEMLSRIAALDVPRCDPIMGVAGPLVRLWKRR